MKFFFLFWSWFVIIHNVKNLGCWSWWPNHLPRMTQWIQYKLGKQYLLKKVTLPWESNPGPTPIRGDPATLVASVGLKKVLDGGS